MREALEAFIGTPIAARAAPVRVGGGTRSTCRVRASCAANKVQAFLRLSGPDALRRRGGTRGGGASGQDRRLKRGAAGWRSPLICDEKMRLSTENQARGPEYSPHRYARRRCGEPHSGAGPGTLTDPVCCRRAARRPPPPSPPPGCPRSAPTG